MHYACSRGNLGLARVLQRAGATAHLPPVAFHGGSSSALREAQRLGHKQFLCRFWSVPTQRTVLTRLMLNVQRHIAAAAAFPAYLSYLWRKVVEVLRGLLRGRFGFSFLDLRAIYAR